MNGRGHVVAAALMLMLGAQAGIAQNGSCLPEQSTLDPSEFRGFFEGPLGGGSTATGVTGMTGWVMAVNGVQHVQILVDDVAAMDAHYGQNRTGHLRPLPRLPRRRPDRFRRAARHRAFHQRHAHRQRPGHRQRRPSDPAQPIAAHSSSTASHLLAPFGDLESPPENANLIGRCDIGNPNRHLTAFVGFALDTGVEVGHRGRGLGGAADRRRDLRQHPPRLPPRPSQPAG